MNQTYYRQNKIFHIEKVIQRDEKKKQALVKWLDKSCRLLSGIQL